MNKFNISNEQSIRINILKFILCVFIVCIHCREEIVYFDGKAIDVGYPFILNCYKTFTDNIHAYCNSCFFFISSILLYRKNFVWHENVKKKIKTLVLPYFFVNSIQILIFNVFQHIPFTQQFFGDAKNVVATWGIKGWLSAYGFFGLPICGPLWFLRDLFVLNLLSVVLKVIVDKLDKFAFPLLLLIFLFCEKSIAFFLGTSNICMWCFGYLIVKYNINIDKFDRSKLLMTSYFIIIILCSVLTLNNIKFFGYQLGKLNIICSIMFWYNIVTVNYKNSILQTLNKLSIYTFPIFIFHWLVAHMLTKIILKFGGINPYTNFPNMLFVPIISITIIIPFAYIMKKYTPKIYSLITGMR